MKDEIEYNDYENTTVMVIIDGKRRLPLKLYAAMTEPLVAIMEDDTVVVSKVDVNTQYDPEWFMDDGEYLLACSREWRNVYQGSHTRGENKLVPDWDVSDFESDVDVDDEGTPLYKIEIKDIVWDTDDTDGDPPKETTWTLEDYPLTDEEYAHPSDETMANIISEVSDQSWFCIKSANVHKVTKNPPLTSKGAALRELPSWAWKFVGCSDNSYGTRMWEVDDLEDAAFVWCLGKTFVADIRHWATWYKGEHPDETKTEEELCVQRAEATWKRTRTVMQGDTAEVTTAVAEVKPGEEFPSVEQYGGLLTIDVEKDTRAHLIEAMFENTHYTKEQIAAGIERAKDRYRIVRYSTTDTVC